MIRALQRSFWFRRKLVGTFQVTASPRSTSAVPLQFYSGSILSFGRVRASVVAVDGRVEVRPMLQLTICVDHVATDGTRAAALVNEIAAVLESESSSTRRARRWRSDRPPRAPPARDPGSLRGLPRGYERVEEYRGPPVTRFAHGSIDLSPGERWVSDAQRISPRPGGFCNASRHDARDGSRSMRCASGCGRHLHALGRARRGAHAGAQPEALPDRRAATASYARRASTSASRWRASRRAFPSCSWPSTEAARRAGHRRRGGGRAAHAPRRRA